MLQKLTQELEEVIDDPLHLPAWTTLEKLPYLSGVVQVRRTNMHALHCMHALLLTMPGTEVCASTNDLPC